MFNVNAACWIISSVDFKILFSPKNSLKETATLKANESEMQALIKPCNWPQTQSKSNEKLDSYRYLYSRELKAMEGIHF